MKSVAAGDTIKQASLSELLPLKDINKINYYIDITINQNLSKREFRKRIKSKEYERLDESTKNKLIENQKTNVSDFIKNPIIIKSNLSYENNTIGIILSKRNNKIVLEYCSDSRIFFKEFILN